MPMPVSVTSKEMRPGRGLLERTVRLAACGSELDRILEQVPKNLVQAGGVGAQMVLGGAQFDGDSQILGADVVPADFQRGPDQGVGIHGSPAEAGPCPWKCA